MVLKLDIKRTLSSRSDRVKCVDFHPTEPWLLVSLYNGQVHIWNYENQSLVKSFEICELPTRTGKFIARKNWFVVGSDDLHMRVFNYNTYEKIHAFEAHNDYIRCVAVHPTQPFVLSCADDSLIKLWDWEKGWKNIMVFEGHGFYIMNVTFNPKDANTFASASLDKTVKVWSLNSSHPNFSLEGHEKGVNWVDYYHGGDKPYLVSAADDNFVKVWDYQNKTCVQTLQGHTNNVSVVCYHPELPIIMSGSEDGTVRLWHANTYRLENTLNYGFERVWTLAYQRGSNSIGIGYDEGTIVIKLGREDPAISMDTSGKIIWAKHNEIQSANVSASDHAQIKDGERLSLAIKDLGNCEVYPQNLQHSPNGRFATVCGDGEFIIYTSLSWRNKTFGSALEFVWALDSNEYAVRENGNKIKTFKTFKDRHIIQTPYTADGLFGGALLGVRGPSFLCLYDWDTGYLVRRVDVQPKNVYWAENGDLLCIACQDNFFLLKYQANVVATAFANGNISEDGVEGAFDVLYDLQDSIKSATWVGDCLIYATATNRLNYLVGGQVNTIAHFDNPMYLLGYIPKDSRVFVCDKDLNVYSYTLSLQVLEYQTAILRKDFALAEKLLPSLNNDQRNRVARYLESLDLKQLALNVTTDKDHSFDLTLQLNQLDLALQIARESKNEQKWKVLGDYALSHWEFKLTEECLLNCQDLSGLLMLYNATGNLDGMIKLAHLAQEQGQQNISFLAFYLSGKAEECVELLISSDRIPEAAFFARTYIPSQVPRIVRLWKENLSNNNFKKIADIIADPIEHESMFPDYKYALLSEMVESGQRKKVIPAEKYPEWKAAAKEDVFAQAKQRFPNSSELPPVIELVKQVLEVTKASAPPSPTKKPDAPPSQSSSTVTSPKKAPESPLVDLGSPKKANLMGPPVGIPPKANPASITLHPPRESANDDFDGISDNMSHLSMEVNTTGSGSIRGDLDVDAVSEFSYTSSDNVASRPPGMITTQAAAAPLSAGSQQKQTIIIPDFDDLDAEMGGPSIAPAPISTQPQAPKSGSSSPQKFTTGDPELDDILNM